MSATGALCFSQMRAGSPWAPVIDVKGSGEAKENPMLPATSFDRFGGGSVMVWGGISMEGRTDLYRLENGSLTAWWNPWTHVRPYAGAVGPGFLPMHDNARPHVARVRRQYLEDEGIDTIEWPSRSPDLNPIEHLWDIMFRSICSSDFTGAHYALRQIWEDIPQDTIVSLGACRDVVKHALFRQPGHEKKLKNFKYVASCS